MHPCFRVITLGLAVLGIWGLVCAQQRTLSVYVIDIYREPIEGVVLSTQGDGSQSDPTDNSGRTHIALPVGTKANDVVFLQLVRGLTLNTNWEILGGERALVPPFDDKPSSFVTVMLIKRVDKQSLANRNYLSSFLGMRPRIPSSGKPEGDAKVAVSSEPSALEDATQAARAVQSEEEQIARDKEQVISTTVFIARSFYSEGRYYESVKAYRQALALREDITISIEFASALVKTKNYNDAESVYEQVLRSQDKNPQIQEASFLPVLEGYLVVLKTLNREYKIAEVQERIAVTRKKIFDRVSPSIK